MSTPPSPPHKHTIAGRRGEGRRDEGGAEEGVVEFPPNSPMVVLVILGQMG